MQLTAEPYLMLYALHTPRANANYICLQTARHTGCSSTTKRPSTKPKLKTMGTYWSCHRYWLPPTPSGLNSIARQLM